MATGQKKGAGGQMQNYSLKTGEYESMSTEELESLAKDKIVSKSKKPILKAQTNSLFNKSKRPVEVTGFANNLRLTTSHHLNHAKEMGLANQKEYENAAKHFWNSENGVFYKGKRRNDFCKYDKSTNRYIVVDNDGVIKTFYKISLKKFEKIKIQEGFEEWKK